MPHVLKRQEGPLAPMAGIARARASVEAEMTDGSLYVAFQPIVDLRRRELFAYEALARSRSQRFSDPLALFQAGHVSGMCGKLGRLLRTLAIQSCPDSALFVNVHPAEFDDGYLHGPDDPIFSHSCPVYVEITESVPLSHFTQCHSILNDIRGKSIMLAVDDLGAGYSNLKYIADLAPEVVKLDKGLVAGIGQDSRQFQLVSQLVVLCQAMGARVVAEGIETIADLHAVIKTGTHYGQGYLFARPAYPAPAFVWPGL